MLCPIVRHKQQTLENKTPTSKDRYLRINRAEKILPFLSQFKSLTLLPPLL